MIIVEIQYLDTDRDEWKNYKLSNIGHDHDSIMIGGRSRLIVNGEVIYPPEEVGKKDD